MESQLYTPTFEDIATEREDIMKQAEKIRAADYPVPQETISQLGHRAFALAHHKFTYPAQSEHLMVSVAASTQDEKIIEMAHDTIDNVFHRQPQAQRDHSHIIANYVIDFTNKERSAQIAAVLAEEQYFIDRGTSSDDVIIRANEEKARKNQAHYEQVAEKYNPFSETVPRDEAYIMWRSAITSLENAHESALRGVYAEEIIEVAEIVAAKVLSDEERRLLDQEAVNQAGDEHYEAKAVDAFIVAQTARKIEELIDGDDIDTDVLTTLNHAAGVIIEALPKEDRRLCSMALEAVTAGHATPLEMIQNIEDRSFAQAA